MSGPGAANPGAVHPRFRVPHRAEVVLAMIVSVLVVTVDLREAIGFSSFGVLLYYVVANLSAFTQDRLRRRFLRELQVLGAAGCLVLAARCPGRPWPSARACSRSASLTAWCGWPSRSTDRVRVTRGIPILRAIFDNLRTLVSRDSDYFTLM